MTDPLNHHALSDDIIYLRSTTGREWRLRPLRPVAPAVQLVQDVTRPTAPPLTLKTIVATSEDALRLALDDAAVWHRALKSDPRHILPLLDVVVHRPNIYFITPYCPGGDLTIQHSERAALRYTALVAAAVEIIISVVQQPSHANLSPAHVLLDHAAVPRIAGWGLSRAQRLKPANHSVAPNELDDVRALAAILYSMLYGRRYDPSGRSQLPDSPSVSPLTQALLRGILIDNCVMELTVFRYDLAAARGLVPPCGPALTPIVNKQREQILGADLDSLHGLNPHIAVPRFSQRGAPVSLPAISNVTENNPSDQQVSTPPKPEPSSPTNVVSADNLTDVSINDTVRAVTSGDLSVASDAMIENLIDTCNVSDQAPIRIFKVFFRLPISKNPIVAYKVAMLLHRFLAEGSAKLTAQSITNDDFLKWMESSWSRERIRNKSGKVHPYTYCFSTGEIAEYTSLIRKRCEVHSNYSQSFTTHWMVRANGFSSLGAKRRDAFRGIVGVNEKCSAVLRKIATCGDPAAEMKRSAVPPIVTELSKSYTILCWIYCMTPEDSRRELFEELSIAHRATRSSLNIVLDDNELAKKCHPAALFEMSEKVDTSFTESDLISTLKKFRKKKRHKAVATATLGPEHSEGVEAKSNPGVAEESVDHTDSGHSNALGSDAPNKPEILEAAPNGNYRSRLTRKSSSSETDDEKNKYDESEEAYMDIDGQRSDPTMSHWNEEEHRSSSFSKSNQPQGSHSVRETNGRHLSNPECRPTIPINGLKKLSVSVRKGNYHNGLRQQLSPNALDEHGENSSNFENGVVRTSIHHESANEIPNGRERHTLSAEDEEWIVDEEPDGRNRKTKSSRNKKEGRHRKGGRSSSRKQPSETESDDTSDAEGGDQKRKTRKGKITRKMSDNSAASSEAIGLDEVIVKKSYSEKKGERKKLDEKTIPFDKNPPTKKKSAECSKKSKSKGDANVNMVDDYSGGSKEALAAAAQGRKTPVMNPEFEIAPYEVHDGPQVGSGGFGVVYKAKFRNETVAVKKIHKHALSNVASVTEFQSEVAVLCTLRHPNILRFVGACTKPPNLMILTEFMAGGTLFDLLHQSQTRVTWPMRKKFALDTCRGMRYLHDSKLLHRDLKSSNLMIDKEYNCKVGDFGLTRISRGSAAVQMTGQCGTFQYMAVEVLANKPYSEKADVFSFGILLWEMIARKLPYFGMQPMQVGIAVLQQGLRPTIPAKTPLPLCNMMRACWDSDPNRRPSFAQLVAALESMPE